MSLVCTRSATLERHHPVDPAFHRKPPTAMISIPVLTVRAEDSCLTTPSAIGAPRPSDPGSDAGAASALSASFEKPSALEDRGHRLFDSRPPCRGLLGRRKVVQITPLPARRQRLEGALETWIFAQPFAELFGNGIIRG